MLTHEELKARQQGLGASDVAAVLGLSPFKSRYELYVEKTSDNPERFQKETKSTKAGQLEESVIAAMYEEATGNATRQCGRLLHPEVPFLYATPDRLVTTPDGQEKGLEIKNVGFQRRHAWGPSGTHRIPEYYYPQIADCMMVANQERWDVAARIGGSDLRVYTFYRDREFETILLEECESFWRQHVEKRVPPPFETGSLRAQDFLKRLYPTVESTSIDLPEEAGPWAVVLEECKRLAKQYDTQAKWAANQILHYMGSHGKAYLPDGSYFVRKAVSVKGHAVPARTDIRLEYKKPKEKNNDPLYEND